MRWASHIAAFAAGALVATALGAHAVPERHPRKSRDRYASLDTFAQALSYIMNNYVDEIDEKALMYGAVEGMVERLDSHSTFYPPRSYQRLQEDTEGEFGGVGLSLRDPEPEEPPFPVVERVVRRSPADLAGLRPGDWIVEIGGEATGGEGRRPPAGSWHSRLRGRTGTHVRLEVMRRGWDRSKRRVLVRKRIKLPTVVSSALDHGIGYLAIDRFQEATARDTAAALGRLEERGPIRGLILDLRGNPGGLLDQAVRVADLFLRKGVIVTVTGRRGAVVERESAHTRDTFSGFPMLVLVNGGSASAAEIVAAALRDHGRAKVVGTPTYGKGSVQTFLDLKDGSGLKLTTSRYYTPAGRSIQGVGIEPDVQVGEGEESKEGAGKLAEDRQLSAAYQILRKRMGAGRP